MPSTSRKPASAILVAAAIDTENISASSLIASAFWSSKDAVAIERFTSTCQPVSFEVSLTFWPRLPIASEYWSDATTTCTVFGSTGSTSIDSSLAGASAPTTYWRMSSFQRTMSIFSPFSSSTIVRTRLPRWPTHAPTGSTFSFEVRTASFAR